MVSPFARSANSGRFIRRARDIEVVAAKSDSRAVTGQRHTPQEQHSPSNPSTFQTSSVGLYTNGITHDVGLHDVTGSAGRPPTKISLQSYDRLQQTTNGVRSTIEIGTEDLLDSAPTSTIPLVSHVAKEAKPHTPTSATDKEKRVLRSKDGASRSLKTELVRFFPDYEDAVLGEPKEPELLTNESVLFITDKKVKGQAGSEASTTPLYQLTEDPKPDALVTTGPSSDIQIAEPTGWERVDFGPFMDEARGYLEDPLSETVFLKAHKRGERREKQLRNIEKEHALHEKSDLERLLEDMKGPDWLKAMGMTGITGTEKKKFESYREVYISRVKALLDKFSAWKEQEMQLKLKREEVLSARENEVDADEAEESVADDTLSLPADLEASARQLQQEARAATRKAPRITLHFEKPILSIEPPKPFTSFYSKSHLRAAALGKHRRGRTITAFGLPLPEPKESKFQLPDDWITEEVIMANARKRRRLKRASHANEHD